MNTLFRIHFSSLFPIAMAVSAHAQTASHPDPHSGEPVFLEDYVVTATPFRREQADVAAATTVLGSRALQLKRQSTLGETLSGEVGMAATAFGPGASRPIIRGLGGDRIRILENGAGTLDASVTSPDHAVSVEPFLVERIEVVRGPASLLYGSSAVGGVVNVITHRIEEEMPEKTLSGTVDARHGGANDERAYGGVADIAVRKTSAGAWLLHLDGYRRRTGDLRIPGFAESARLRAEEAAEAHEHGETVPEETPGTLPNSRIASDGGAVGVSWVTPSSSLGFAYSGFDSIYGVPGHAHTHEDDDVHENLPEGEKEETVRIDLRQRRLDIRGELRRETGSLRTLRFKFGRADYRHRELEGEEVGTVFTNRGFDARIEALHAPVSGFEGAWGAQMSRSDFAAVGDETFLPPSVTQNRALFIFEEAKTGALTWQFGARYENQEIDIRASRTGRDDDALSASAGLVWAVTEPYVLAFSVSRTERAPNVQELFSNGPHVGTNAFEIGDPALANETSLGVELSLRRRTGFVTGAVGVFMNRFNGYIFEQRTGEEADGLDVYRYAQRDADFWGAELEAIFHLHSGSRHQWDLRIAGDLTRAEEEGGMNLPRIPPVKGSLGLSWANGPFAAGAELQRFARQDRVAPDETVTAGYNWLSAYFTYRLARGPATWDFFLRGTNLMDDEARVHTSFLKELAPLSGRSVTGGVRLSF